MKDFPARPRTGHDRTLTHHATSGTSLARVEGNVNPRVLVIDDEPNHVHMMEMGLRLEGFDVQTACDAQVALGMLASGPFDLAIVDLMMPGTNGIELARLLRQKDPRVRVILTSAYHLSKPQLIHADCGAVGFLPKPFDLGELTRFLKEKLSGDDSPSASAGAAA